mgnify:CR=1 FL=1
MFDSSKPFTFDRVIRILIGITVVVFLFLLLKKLSDALLPFLIAWLLAYLIHPIVNLFQYKLKLKSRILSIITTMLLLMGVVFLVVWFAVPLIKEQITKVSDFVAAGYGTHLEELKFLPLSWQQSLDNYLSSFDAQSILKDEKTMAFLQKAAPQVWSIVSGSLGFLTWFVVLVIVFIYLIFILLDYEKIVEQWYILIPPRYREIITSISKDLEMGMNRYFRGQALVALITGSLYCIGFTVIGLPLSILLGIFIGILCMIPYMQIIGVLSGLLLVILKTAETGQSFASVLVSYAIVYAIVELTQDIILIPKIMGKITGLNPAIILLSLSVWGSLMGIAGMIIALPITTLMISYYKRFVLGEIDTHSSSVKPSPPAEKIENT